MNNMYYNPEDNGLESVGELSWIDESYEFDLTAVWKKKRGEYYYASDSGCSCPCPFEDLTESDLAGPYTKAELRNRLQALVSERTDSDSGYYNGKAEMMGQVSALLSRLT